MTARQARRLLVVVDDAGPGDALRSMAALSAIRATYATAHITLVVSEAAASVFETARPCDRVVVSHVHRPGLQGWRSRVRKAVQVGRLLREVGTGYDLALVLNWGTTTLDVFARLASKRVIGFKNRAPLLLSGSLGTYDVEGDPVEQNWNLLRVAGVERVPSPTIPASGRVTRPATLDDLEMPTPYAVLHTGSDWACQQWAQEAWAELADRIATEHGVTIVWTGLAEEAAYIGSIQTRMVRPSISVAGKTTLERLRQLIANAGLFVCVDSAPYEIAQLTDTPIVVLAGPTSARAHLGGLGRCLVVNRSPARIGYRIRECQRAHVGGRCHDYSCPLAQLPYLRVDDVMAAIAKVELTLALPAPT